jgi:dephospho-CoA kinase
MSDWILGLTGGIASGKSLAEAAFAARGIFVADADAAARAVLAPDSPGLAEVVAAFGPQVLNADGSLDRAAMRRRIFADTAARRTLEAIVHPRVRSALHAACVAADSPYAIASIPLLAESGGRSTYPWLRRILVVDARDDLRLQRLQQRDGIDASLAQRMLDAQASRAQRLAIADDVLRNDASPSALDAHVAQLDRLYRRLASADRADSAALALQ